MKNFNTRWMIVILLICYLFFLTSGWTMKRVLANREYKSTELEVPCSLSEDITVSVLGWSWAEDQGIMEVELEIINVREDLNRVLVYETGYRETPETGKRTPLKNQLILDEGIYKVLWIYMDDGTVFSEVVLKIIDPDGNSLSLYTNIDIISRVDRIEKLTAEEYILRRYQATLDGYIKTIEEYEVAIQEKMQLIENLEIINEELSSMHFSTPEEMQRTETMIQNNKDKQEDYLKEIGELENRIVDLRERSVVLQEKLDSFTAE